MPCGEPDVSQSPAIDLANADNEPLSFGASHGRKIDRMQW